jgi:hypothetical protein
MGEKVVKSGWMVQARRASSLRGHATTSPIVGTDGSPCSTETYFRYKHDRPGHCFQGGYKAPLVAGDDVLLEAMRPSTGWASSGGWCGPPWRATPVCEPSSILCGTGPLTIPLRPSTYRTMIIVPAGR